MCGFSLVAVSRDHPLAAVRRPLPLWSMGPGHTGFSGSAHGLSGCSPQAPEHRLSSCGAWAQLL